MTNRIDEFRRLHASAEPLILPNAWDAGSARLIESCGARAIATTSSGVAWSRGYPDGDALPPSILASVVAEIVRVVSVPVSIDIEGGYSSDPEQVGALVAELAAAGAAGVNLEDGSGSPQLLCAKLSAARKATARAGIDVFLNARTDVYLKSLVPAERAVAETIERARLYREAGSDGLFVPRLTREDDIRKIAATVGIPLNVMLVPGLPSPARLGELGVRRISAGAALVQAAYGLVARGASRLLQSGEFADLFEGAATYPATNALFAAPAH